MSKKNKDVMPPNWTKCIECKKGINGEKSCSAGWRTKSAKMGCFCGEKKENDK